MLELLLAARLGALPPFACSLQDSEREVLLAQDWHTFVGNERTETVR